MSVDLIHNALALLFVAFWVVVAIISRGRGTQPDFSTTVNDWAFEQPNDRYGKRY